MADHRTIVTAALALASANTEYDLVLPVDASRIRLKLANAANVWRYSSTTGEVAGGSGCTVSAAGEVIFDGPSKAQTIYIAAANASQTLNVSYEVPYRSYSP